MKQIAIWVAKQILAAMLCFCLVFGSANMVAPYFEQTQQNIEIEEQQIRVNIDEITSRGSLNERTTQYTLYKLVINNEKELYFDNIDNANVQKDYLLNNTSNLSVDVIEFTQNNKNNLSAEEEIKTVVENYLQQYKKITTCFPTNSHYITSSYGSRRGSHTGIDLCGNYGDNIYAYKNGTVINVQYSNVSYGNMILLEHEDGMQTRYAHLSSIKVVKGQQVNCGQIIGGMGSTGNSTGNHLHFEVIINSRTVNPYNYIF